MYQRSVFEENRRRILKALLEQPMDFTSLRDRTALSEPTLSRHLQHLLQAGFVEVKREGKRKIYSIAEKGLEELFPHLLGVSSALRAMKGRDFAKSVGEELMYVIHIRDALESFAACISRFTPTINPDGSGRLLFGSIVEEMRADFEELKRLRDTIAAIEERGGDAEGLREELGKKLEKLNSIYLALGPPFSYMWRKMIEGEDFQAVLVTPKSEKSF
ncbi:ArsR/SmtB family transcription factor [Archaeoglobus veneficus]|uniref:Regulatory protein ArsR n=1 Tax=Archaeoglobus veneficus (strain DSM 11195 / SNP6) TaxID=693661 RepID=F2KRD6_ARCVS|nr:metalloregulator ArsR/SmtB family transcription factor [Archaeoglobus veneficus]AEA47870.1 regulatory protein ArsR [Archaeoglobus veneficus SNP6]